LADYLTEQEQVQQLKNWLKYYGPTIILGIIIALLISGGWRYWQNYQNRVLTHASAVYDQMLALRAQNNTNESLARANRLITHYTKTPYAPFAAMELARHAVIQKNYVEAIKQLNWAIQYSHIPALREIARIRIARIMITQKNPAAALDILKNTKDSPFMGLIDEVRGDAYLAQNNSVAARLAYQHALDELPNADVSRPVLQMKYDNLAS
jgi:predicted negative regulator of RcsB-dependent stress response